jgi:hypothetical protein
MQLKKCYRISSLIYIQWIRKGKYSVTVHFTVHPNNKRHDKIVYKIYYMKSTTDIVRTQNTNKKYLTHLTPFGSFNAGTPYTVHFQALLLLRNPKRTSYDVLGTTCYLHTCPNSEYDTKFTKFLGSDGSGAYLVLLVKYVLLQYEC